MKAIHNETSESIILHSVVSNILKPINESNTQRAAPRTLTENGCIKHTKTYKWKQYTTAST